MAAPDASLILASASAIFNELSPSTYWRASLDQAAIRPKPLFVKTLRPEHPAARSLVLPDFAIVTVARAAGVTARFALHADNGQFLEAEGVTKAGALLPDYADVAAIAAAHSPGASGNGEWVWQPCQESTSRFLPFWRFPVGSHFVHVRADGKIFDSLTSDILG